MRTSDVIDNLPSRDQLLAALGLSKPPSLDDLPSRDRVLSALGLAQPPSSNVSSAWMLGAGVLIGAGLALLFAPKPGQELRQNLRRRFAPDRNERFADEVRDEGGLPGPVKHIAP